MASKYKDMSRESSLFKPSIGNQENTEEQIDKAWKFFFDGLEENGHSALNDNYDFPERLYPAFLDRLTKKFGQPTEATEPMADNRFTRKKLLLAGDNLFRIYYGYEGKPTLIQAHRVRGEKKTILSHRELNDLKMAGLDTSGLSTN